MKTFYEVTGLSFEMGLVMIYKNVTISLIKDRHDILDNKTIITCFPSQCKIKRIQNETKHDKLQKPDGKRMQGEF